MTTIHQILAKVSRPMNKHKGRIGLEIETESREPYDPPKLAFWETKGDGSLRNFGIEYVLKHPLDFRNGFPEALEEFRDKTKGIDFIKDSITTSVHVHLNILNEDLRTLTNFFVAYTLVENLLVHYCSETRRSNGFSLPICDAEETYIHMRDMLSCVEDGYYQGLLLGDDVAKYSGLNLASINRFGSLEVRLFQGETDIEKIHKWVSILNRIFEFAQTKGMYPADIIVQFKQKDLGLLQDIFKEDYPDIRHPDEEKLIHKNFLYAGNLAYQIKNWKKLESKEKPKEPVGPNEADRLAQEMYQRAFVELQGAQQRAIMNEMNRQVIFNQAAARQALGVNQGWIAMPDPEEGDHPEDDPDF